MIKVAIADDHSLVRQGLRRYLEMADGIEVVGEASDGRELLTLIEETNRTSHWWTSGCPRWTASRPRARSATGSPRWA